MKVNFVLQIRRLFVVAFYQQGPEGLFHLDILFRHIQIHIAFGLSVYHLRNV